MAHSNNPEILDREVVFHKSVFRIEKIRFRPVGTDGQLRAPLERLNLDRGDSVAALVHDVKNDQVLLAEQFRISTHDKGPGWILELPAGILEAGEEPEEATRREVEEEIGYSIDKLTHIATVYASPGGSSERLHIYYVPVSDDHHTSLGGGLESEGEDIRTVKLNVNAAFAKLDTGEIADAKTFIALQWLRLNRATKAFASE